MKRGEVYIRQKSGIREAAIGDPVVVTEVHSSERVEVRNLYTGEHWMVHQRHWHNYKQCSRRNPFKRVVRGNK